MGFFSIFGLGFIILVTFSLCQKGIIPWYTGILIVLGISYGFFKFRRYFAFRDFRHRKDNLEIWELRFGRENGKLIEQYLSLFCKSFDCPLSLKYKFAPDEHLNAYYQKYYAKGEVDSLEHAIFFQEIEKIFGVVVEDSDYNSEISLGEFFKNMLLKSINSKKNSTHLDSHGGESN